MYLPSFLDQETANLPS